MDSDRVTSGEPASFFCPYCGSATEERGGELVCPVGYMPFSPHMAAVLSVAFVERTATPSAEPLPFRVGGRWYCPRCGDRMITEPHDVRCARCALHLNEFLVELVEMHSHGGIIDPLTGEHVYDPGRRQAE